MRKENSTGKQGGGAGRFDKVGRPTETRHILADQAYNAFSAFPPNALCRISPDEIRK